MLLSAMVLTLAPEVETRDAEIQTQNPCLLGRVVQQAGGGIAQFLDLEGSVKIPSLSKDVRDASEPKLWQVACEQTAVRCKDITQMIIEENLSLHAERREQENALRRAETRTGIEIAFSQDMVDENRWLKKKMCLFSCVSFFGGAFVFFVLSIL